MLVRLEKEISVKVDGSVVIVLPSPAVGRFGLDATPTNRLPFIDDIPSRCSFPGKVISTSKFPTMLEQLAIALASACVHIWIVLRDDALVSLAVHGFEEFIFE
jgi:hypothetical protein